MAIKPTDTSVEESQDDATDRRHKGEFVRGASGFRNLIDDADFPAQPQRYHLFVALNCPWCHRVTLARNILGLQDSITLDVAFPGRTDNEDPAGANLWQFNPERVATLTGKPFPECTAETATGHSKQLVKQIYALEGSNEKSVPILYDKIAKRIVNNESAEIVRTLNANTKALASSLPENQRPNLYPDDPSKQQEIDALNILIYNAINNGAYKAGFSSNQSVYVAAFKDYFDTLSILEARLAADDRSFLTGDTFSEADLRLFPTLFRHDPVYYLRMKLNAAKIVDFPHLWRWLCRVYALHGVAESNSLDHCKQGYFGRSWNNVIPLGPNIPMAYPEAYKHPELAK